MILLITEQGKTASAQTGHIKLKLKIICQLEITYPRLDETVDSVLISVKTYILAVQCSHSKTEAHRLISSIFKNKFAMETESYAP